MDIMDELKDLQKQKRLQRKVTDRTFQDHCNIISNRLQRINGELTMLLHELAHGMDQNAIDGLNKIMQEFQAKELQDLQEKLKETFY